MPTSDEVRDHNEKVLRNLERNTLVEKFMLSIGCNDAQASTVAKAYSERFTYDGAALNFQGKPVIDARDDVVAHFKSAKLDFLLPPEKELKRLDVDPALLAKAKAGNMTARSQLFVQVGRDQSKLDDLLAAKSDDITDPVKDTEAKKNKTAHASNPFHKSNWNLTKQSALLRAVGPAKCAAIAAAVGVTIGATKPNMDF